LEAHRATAPGIPITARHNFCLKLSACPVRLDLLGVRRSTGLTRQDNIKLKAALAVFVTQ